MNKLSEIAEQYRKHVEYLKAEFGPKARGIEFYEAAEAAIRKLVL